MDLTRAPNITKVLLESAGARLQHLQLAVDVGPHDQPWYGFWRAVRTCTELVALQLVFVEEHPGDNGQQVLYPNQNAVSFLLSASWLVCL